MKLQRCPRPSLRRGGFSLAELMVVIVILGLLATIVVPNVLERLGEASVGAAKTDITSISQALDLYAINNGGRYPETLEELILEDEHGKRYLKNYESVPLDPWKNEYQYDPPQGDQDYRVYSFGSDRQPGGEGDAADIDNVSIKQRK